jgi:hypothetical protein
MQTKPRKENGKGGGNTPLGKSSVYYYYQICNAVLGPYKFGELMTLIEGGDVTSMTLVWREGINQWHPLSVYREFHFSSEQGQSGKNQIGRRQVMETEALSKRKNPYYVLGVPSFASKGQIKSAYKKRVQALRPYRFDQATQSQDWNILNDVLRELTEAYADVYSAVQKEKVARTPSSGTARHDIPLNRGNGNGDKAIEQTELSHTKSHTVILSSVHGKTTLPFQ